VRLERQPGSDGAGNQTQFLGSAEKIEGTIATLERRDFEIGPHHDLAEAVSRFRLAHPTAGFHLQVGKVELGGDGNGPQCGGIATGDGGELEFLRSPSALESPKFRGGAVK
jgi:hypothetical protein